MDEVSHSQSPGHRAFNWTEFLPRPDISGGHVTAQNVPTDFVNSFSPSTQRQSLTSASCNPKKPFCTPFPTDTDFKMYNKIELLYYKQDLSTCQKGAVFVNVFTRAMQTITCFILQYFGHKFCILCLLRPPSSSGVNLKPCGVSLNVLR